MVDTQMIPSTYNSYFAAPSPESFSNSLEIINLSEDCNERDLFNLFSTFGKIDEFIIKRCDNHSSSGFIKYNQYDQAASALSQMNGQYYYGRCLSINWVSNLNHQSKKTYNEKATSSAAIHVTYFSDQVDVPITEETLLNLFSSFGEIIHCFVKPKNIDKVQKIQSGYGFIYFVNDSNGINSAINAVSMMHNKIIDRVNYKCDISRKLYKKLNHIENVTKKANNLNTAPEPPFQNKMMNSNFRGSDGSYTSGKNMSNRQDGMVQRMDNGGIIPSQPWQNNESYGSKIVSPHQQMTHFSNSPFPIDTSGLNRMNEVRNHSYGDLKHYQDMSYEPSQVFMNSDGYPQNSAFLDTRVYPTNEQHVFESTLWDADYAPSTMKANIGVDNYLSSILSMPSNYPDSTSGKMKEKQFPSHPGFPNLPHYQDSISDRANIGLSGQNLMFKNENLFGATNNLEFRNDMNHEQWLGQEIGNSGNVPDSVVPINRSTNSPYVYPDPQAYDYEKSFDSRISMAQPFQDNYGMIQQGNPMSMRISSQNFFDSGNERNQSTVLNGSVKSSNSRRSPLSSNSQRDLTPMYQMGVQDNSTASTAMHSFHVNSLIGHEDSVSDRTYPSSQFPSTAIWSQNLHPFGIDSNDASSAVNKNTNHKDT